MSFSDEERQGIGDLLLNEKNILMQLAKSLTKNIRSVSNEEDALDIVLTHGCDAYTLLGKKLITKELLFKYLIKHQISIELNVTKPALISKTLNFWNKTSQSNGESRNCDNSTTEQIQTHPRPSTNEVANAFAEWFFNRYNKDELQETDFWSDANLQLRIIANDATEESVCHIAKDVLSILMEKKLQFGFYFNFNNSKNGIQGRMDVHGMLLVLTCGTLHTREACVGVFECLFGLLRDPFDSNNWKMKTIRCLLRSQSANQMPTLDESEMLKDALAIPVITETN